IRGLRTPEFLFTETSGREPVLYDLECAPGPVRSVIGDPDFAATHGRLNAEPEELASCVGDGGRTTLPRQFRGRSAPGDDSMSGDDGSGDDTESEDESKGTASHDEEKSKDESKAKTKQQRSTDDSDGENRKPSGDKDRKSG